ncbi:MAG: hypothetical protein GEV06_05270 [Luteitalea sp.]|nr:hypothetical protein [Luteitalea sp.]
MVRRVALARGATRRGRLFPNARAPQPWRRRARSPELPGRASWPPAAAGAAGDRQAGPVIPPVTVTGRRIGSTTSGLEAAQAEPSFKRRDRALRDLERRPALRTARREVDDVADIQEAS